MQKGTHAENAVRLYFHGLTGSPCGFGVMLDIFTTIRRKQPYWLYDTFVPRAKFWLPNNTSLLLPPSSRSQRIRLEILARGADETRVLEINSLPRSRSMRISSAHTTDLETQKEQELIGISLRTCQAYSIRLCKQLVQI